MDDPTKIVDRAMDQLATLKAVADARTLLAELETFHANNAGDRAIKILRRLVETASPITSAELVERTGDNPGPVDTQGFPPELREPSPLVATPPAPARVRVKEADPVAYWVHDFSVPRTPVNARGRFDEPTEYFYPASRVEHARNAARVMRGKCTPLYATPPRARCRPGRADRGGSGGGG